QQTHHVPCQITGAIRRRWSFAQAMSPSVIADDSKILGELRRHRIPNPQIAAQRIGKHQRWLVRWPLRQIMKNTITDIQKSHRLETIRGLSAMSTCVWLVPYRLQKKRLHASRARGRNFPKTLKLSPFLLSWSKDGRRVLRQTTFAAEKTL